MAIGARSPRFYVGVLTLGFILGGFLSALLEWLLPESPAKDFFTFSVNPEFGPVAIDLLILAMTLGPFSINFSLLGITGVAIAYLVARSLF